MRACLEPPSFLTTTCFSSTLTSTASVSLTDSSPSLPLAFSRPAASETVTPLGTLTGFFPTRDMASSLEHAADDFAADIGRARLVIRHHAARRRQDRDAQPVEDAGNLGDLGIDAPAGP